MIEVYKTAAHLEHDWVKEIFTPDELKQYAEFEKAMKNNNSQAIFEKQWQELLQELKHHAKENPDSMTGIQFGDKYMTWLNGIYGKKYAHLRTIKWERGFGEGKGLLVKRWFMKKRYKMKISVLRQEPGLKVENAHKILRHCEQSEVIQIGTHYIHHRTELLRPGSQ